MRGAALDPALQASLRAALSLLLLSAAVHKLRDLERFRSALAAYELLPSSWVAPAAIGLVAAELGLAAGLCWTPAAPGIALATAGLIALYAGAVAVNLGRGLRDIDCGCAGPSRRQPLSPGLVLRNVVLAAAAAACALPAGSRPLTWVDAVTIAGSVAALALSYAAAEDLFAAASRTAAWSRPSTPGAEPRPGPEEVVHA